MNRLTYLKNIILRGGIAEEEYSCIVKDISEHNRTIVMTGSLLAAAAMGLLFAVSFFSAALAPNRYLYLIGCLLSVSIFLTAKFPGKKNRTAHAGVREERH